MSVTKVFSLDNLVILQKEAISDFWSVRGLFKETNGKNWEFCVEKEMKRKTRMAKRAQKSVTKKRVNF